jgi:hypothetical protein
MRNRLVMRLIVLANVATFVLAGQVRFTPDKIDVEIDGKPFTTFQFGTDVGKPFLAPLRSASGKIVTRHFPMENVAGESNDHPHHRGLWFSYDDVNGTQFWGNDPSFKNPKTGRIIVNKAEWKEGQSSGTLVARMEWRDPSGKVLLLEDRSMLFHSDPTLRIIDFDIKLTPAGQPVTFGDTKEGAFAIRLADALAEKNGTGKMINASGQSGMNNVWGKRSPWVDYSGEIEGEKLGVAILDHPSNQRHPTYWHSRDYGLFALDPFGRKAFDKNAEESHWTVEPGQSLRFQWRVVIHPGDATSAKIADLFKQYAGGK